MKTLAELKREANAQTISAEMVYRYGKEIPERLRGIRKAVRANTVAVFFQNADGAESELSIKSASLIDYDGESLTIYEAGKRQPNPEEMEVLNAYKKAEMEHIKSNPFSDCYLFMVSFFKKNQPFEYLSGFETVRGKRYNRDGTITDRAIKGDVIIRYKIYRH